MGRRREKTQKFLFNIILIIGTKLSFPGKRERQIRTLPKGLTKRFEKRANHSPLIKANISLIGLTMCLRKPY